MATRRWIRDPLTLVVAALASYRMTRLVTTDHIPPAVAPRTWLEDHTPTNYVSLWTCPWCIGFWVAAGVTVTGNACGRKHRDTFLAALMPWALSAAVGLLSDREIA